jgi:hypothetical protein
VALRILGTFGKTTFATLSTQSGHDGRWILQVSYLNQEHREQDYSKSAGAGFDLVELSLTKKW